MAALLGFQTISINSQAVAAVNSLGNPPCSLALTGPLSFQGSANINTPGCTLASNDPANNAISFTGNGNSLNLCPASGACGSLLTAGGCSGSSTYCGSALTYRPPVTDPFSALDAVTLPTLSNCSSTSSLTVYSAGGPCKNNNVTLTGNSNITLNGGVYFISGTLTLKGNGGIDGTGLIILLPGASFSLKGNGAIDLTANASLTNAQLPAALQPDASLLADMALYDQSSTAVSIGGNSNITFVGNMYAPNATVTFQGNPVINLGGGKGCGQLIAASIAFNGNATFDDSGCPTGTVATAQYVALVQ